MKNKKRKQRFAPFNIKVELRKKRFKLEGEKKLLVKRFFCSLLVWVVFSLILAVSILNRWTFDGGKMYNIKGYLVICNFSIFYVNILTYRFFYAEKKLYMLILTKIGGLTLDDCFNFFCLIHKTTFVKPHNFIIQNIFNVALYETLFLIVGSFFCVFIVFILFFNFLSNILLLVF